MKTVVFIGKMNEVYSDVSEGLKEYFLVQNMTRYKEGISDILRLSKPDIIIISLIGLQEEDGEMFLEIQRNYPSIPVITIGTEFETQPFMRYLQLHQFENIERPTNNPAIIKKCFDRIHEEEPIHILVVDDNAMLLRGLKKLLGKKYSVAVAASGTQAFTSIGRKKPDLILLDYEMPVTNGKAVLEMIRADEALAQIPVVFLTSVADKTVVQELISLKPAAYILKPPEPDTLFSTIETVLNI